MKEKYSGKAMAAAVIGLGIAAVIITIIVMVSSANIFRSTPGLADDLGSKDAGRIKRALESLTRRGPECVPELVQAYKKSTDVVHRKRIARAIIRMHDPDSLGVLVPALIELLSMEQDARLRQEIVGGLRALTNRMHLLEDPLGDDVDAWREWWREEHPGETQDDGGKMQQ